MFFRISDFGFRISGGRVPRMSETPGAQPSPASFPLTPFLIWSLAVLAYPACLLVDMLGEGVRVQAAVYALPTLLAQGVLLLPMALLSAAFWAVAAGAGMAVLRLAGYDRLSSAERAVFGSGLGMGILSVATFLLGSVSGQPDWLFTLLCWGLLLALAALGARDLWRALTDGARALNAWRHRAGAYGILLAALGAAIVFVALTRVNVPVFADYDSLEYHLAAPAAWWREGRITFLRDMVYANFPLNAEMLFLLAMNVAGGPVTGATIGLQMGIGFVVLTAAAVAACGRRLGSPEGGKAGAAILLTTPLLAELATLNSYVTELPLAAYGFLALFAFFLLRRAETARERWRYAALCGAMAGLAIGCKYPAVAFVLAPLLAFILGCGVARPSTLRAAIVSCAIALAVAIAAASPWLIRNAVNTGNPTYPLLYDAFGGSNWTPEQQAKFHRYHTPDDLHFFGLARRFWKFAIWRDQPTPPASPVLLLFALVPIALAERRSAWAILLGATVFLLAAAAGRFFPDLLATKPDVQVGCDVLLSMFILALATAPAFLVHAGDVLFLPIHAVLCVMAWYVMTHRLDRFLDPVSPAIALLGGFGLAALGAGWARRLARGFLSGALAYALVTTLLIHSPVIWPFGGLTEAQAAFLRRVSDGSTYSPDAIEAINRELPESAVVLFVGESRTFYCQRRCLAASVFDRGPIERILDAGVARVSEADSSGSPGNPARRVRDGLRALGVTHLYVNWAEVERLASTYRYRYDGREREGIPRQAYSNLIPAMVRDGHLQSIGAFPTDPQGRRQSFFLFALR